MKTLIIYSSIHHQNTLKIAQVLAKTLNARIMKVDEVKPEEIVKYDLVGFGSGIYMWKHHQSLLELVDKIPSVVDSLRPTDTNRGIGCLITNLNCFSRAEVNTNFYSVFESQAKRINQSTQSSSPCCKHKNSHKNCISPRSIISRNAFIFSTSGAGGGIILHKTLRDKLINKGFKIIGEFNCKAWDTFGPLKLIGGINKGHPDEKDLEKAREFAKKLLRGNG